MDDLKTFAKNDEDQQSILTTVKGFHDDIKMESGLDKYAKATFKQRNLTNTKTIKLNLDTVNKDFEQYTTYKYLGISEGDDIEHSKMKKYYRRMRLQSLPRLLEIPHISEIKRQAIDTNSTDTKRTI